MFTGPKIITDGLVLYLDAASQRSYPGSGSTWTDLSPSNNNATLFNSVTYDNANLGTLVFDGVNQYASCSHPTGSSYNITYEIFIKLNETTSNGILSFNNSTYFSGLSILSNTFIGYLSGSNYKYFYNTTVQSGVWYHLVMYVGSSDAKDIKFYVNGILDTTNTSHTGVSYSPTTLYIATSNNSTYWLGCNIALVRCYNRELLENEVKQNFNSVKKRFGL